MANSSNTGSPGPKSLYLVPLLPIVRKFLLTTLPISLLLLACMTRVLLSIRIQLIPRFLRTPVPRATTTRVPLVPRQVCIFRVIAPMVLILRLELALLSRVSSGPSTSSRRTLSPPPLLLEKFMPRQWLVQSGLTFSVLTRRVSLPWKVNIPIGPLATVSRVACRKPLSATLGTLLGARKERNTLSWVCILVGLRAMLRLWKRTRLWAIAQWGLFTRVSTRADPLVLPRFTRIRALLG